MVNIELRILFKTYFISKFFIFIRNEFIRREEDTFSPSFFHSLDSMA